MTIPSKRKPLESPNHRQFDSDIGSGFDWIGKIDYPALIGGVIYSIIGGFISFLSYKLSFTVGVTILQ